MNLLMCVGIQTYSQQHIERRAMTKENLLQKHGIETKVHLHTTIDRNLLAEVNQVIPQRKRSQFLESLIRRELQEIKAS
tara:strand:+ start:147 stop:383 length:237 start_codon:yes stop_codon:yes gene_type:complete